MAKKWPTHKSGRAGQVHPWGIGLAFYGICINFTILTEVYSTLTYMSEICGTFIIFELTDILPVY